jgi:hypothetical protein
MGTSTRPDLPEFIVPESSIWLACLISTLSAIESTLQSFLTVPTIVLAATYADRIDLWLRTECYQENDLKAFLSGGSGSYRLGLN